MHLFLMTTNSVKVMKSVNCPMMKSRSWKEAQLEHIFIMLIAVKRGNTEESREKVAV